MLPPSRPFLPSLSLSLSPRSSRWLGCLTSVATSRPLEGLKHRSTYFITPCQYMQYWYQIPSNPHLQFESATIWNSKATCLNGRDLFFIKIFILTQRLLCIYCLDTALTLTERFDAITLCSIYRKQEASGLNTKDIYSKIVIFWQMEIKWKINI